jgi:TrmH family RNA methyltransferase
MGAILRIKIVYDDLVPFITSAKENGLPVYGTTLNGENIYKMSLSKSGLIVMGNESKGISESLQQLLTKQLFIPFYPADTQRSESLNVAVATGIICAEFRRREMV